MTSSFCCSMSMFTNRGRLSGFLLATTVVASSFAAQPAGGQDRAVWLVAADASRGRSDTPVTVLVEGAAAEVVEQSQRQDQPWEILITVDLPLLSARSLLDSTQVLAERADALAALGFVTISLRSVGRSIVLERSRDPDEIAGALVELGRDGSRAGEYFADRAATRSAVHAAGSEQERRRLLVDHFHQEQELLEWQHNSLVDELLIENSPSWMHAETTAATPRAAFVVRDALGPDAMAFLEEAVRDSGIKKATAEAEFLRLEQRLESAAEAADDALNNSGRSFSATGVNLFPTVWSMLSAAKKDQTPARFLNDATTAEFAQGSGYLIDSAEALDRVLAGLEQADLVRFRPPAPTASSATTITPGGLSREDAFFTRAINVTSPFKGEGNRSLWLTAAPPKQLTLARARRFFEGLENGALDVEAGLLGELAGGATLETKLDIASLGAAADSSAGLTSDRLRVTVLQRRLDANLGLEQLFGGQQPLDKETWLLRSSVRLPADLDQIAVLVEDLDSGRWGAALAESMEASFSAAAGNADVVLEQAVSPQTEIATHASVTASTGNPEPRRTPKDLIGEPSRRASTRFRSPVLQVVAPARDHLKGKQTFAILTATGAVRSVVFYLDDEEVDRDDRAPFAATLDLGQSGAERSIRAAGFSASDLLLGTDEVKVNRALASEGLTITALSQTDGSQADGGALITEASLRLGEGTALDRVEFFRNQQLMATMTSVPLRASVGAPPTADAAARGDFVRVVAWLADGSFMEDVRLLGVGANAGLGDFGAQVQVNLVQVFAVVTDGDGNPIDGLEAGDFNLELNGKPLTIERFSEAEQVPLDMALVIDTSESMWALMDDTRKAAARFLGDTMTDKDRALVIDFDNTVRLVHPLSSEVFDLIGALSRLRASGATALYDAIIFALVNLEDAARSRRAVVLLTDGDDFNSRFEYGRVYDSARFAGVPLYFVALSDFFGEQRRGKRKTDLESFADASGGRVFYVQSLDEILAAYRQITRELRNQYLLTFATEEGLSREELEGVKVSVPRQAGGRGKASVRWTVGRSH